MVSNTSLAVILRTKIVAILRGVNPTQVLPLAEALHAGGVQALEITMNSPGALALIEKLAKRMNGKMLVGAGTVLDAATAQTAIHAGASFIISPSVDVGVIEMTRRLGAVSIPGAYTPTEIVQAHRSGGDLIKVFPAMHASYIQAIRGPLPHIPLMPTGGVTLENIRSFQVAGAVAFGIGSAMVDAGREVDEKYLEEVRITAEKFHAKLQR